MSYVSLQEGNCHYMHLTINAEHDVVSLAEAGICNRPMLSAAAAESVGVPLLFPPCAQ